MLSLNQSRWLGETAMRQRSNIPHLYTRNCNASRKKRAKDEIHVLVILAYLLTYFSFITRGTGRGGPLDRRLE